MCIILTMQPGVDVSVNSVGDFGLGLFFSHRVPVSDANHGYYSFNPYHYVDHTYTQHYDFYACSGIPGYSYRPDSYYQRGATYYHSDNQVTPEK